MAVWGGDATAKLDLPCPVETARNRLPANERWTADGFDEAYVKLISDSKATAVHFFAQRGNARLAKLLCATQERFNR